MIKFDRGLILKILWLVFAAIVVTTASIISGNNWMIIVSSITGVIYSILIAYQNKYGYIFAIINISLYGVVLLLSKTYASAILNLGYSLPMVVYGFFKWGRTKNIIKSVPNKFRLFIFIGLLIAIVSLGFILMALGGTYVWLDSAGTCLSIVGIFLMTNLYKEQWWIWNISNVVYLIMWIIRAVEDVSNTPFTVMWAVYTINSIFGMIRWEIKYKEQQNQKLILNSNLKKGKVL